MYNYLSTLHIHTQVLTCELEHPIQTGSAQMLMYFGEFNIQNIPSTLFALWELPKELSSPGIVDQPTEHSTMHERENASKNQ